MMMCWDRNLSEERGQQGSSPLPAPLSDGHPAPPLHDAAPIPTAAAVHGHPALAQAAFGGQRTPADRAALDVAAVGAGAAIAHHTAAGHTEIGPQLLSRRLTQAIVPGDREKVVAPRAAHRRYVAVREVRPMAAARAHQIRTRRTLRAGHRPLPGRRVTQLEEGAGHPHVASPHPKLHLPWRNRHDRIPGAPTKSAACGRLQAGPLSGRHGPGVGRNHRAQSTGMTRVSS